MTESQRGHPDLGLGRSIGSHPLHWWLSCCELGYRGIGEAQIFVELDHILFVKAEGLLFAKFLCGWVGIHQSAFEITLFEACRTPFVLLCVASAAVKLIRFPGCNCAALA